MISTGLGRVVAFNWPKYVVAIFAVVLGLALVANSNGLLFGASALGLAALVYGIVASLLATWWVYDHKAEELYRVIASEYQDAMPWVMVHAGLDESQRLTRSMLVRLPTEADLWRERTDWSADMVTVGMARSQWKLLQSDSQLSCLAFMNFHQPNPLRFSRSFNASLFWEGRLSLLNISATCRTPLCSGLLLFIFRLVAVGKR